LAGRVAVTDGRNAAARCYKGLQQAQITCGLIDGNKDWPQGLATRTCQARNTNGLIDG